MEWRYSTCNLTRIPGEETDYFPTATKEGEKASSVVLYLYFHNKKTSWEFFLSFLYENILLGQWASFKNQKTFSVNVWALDRNDCTNVIAFNITPNELFLQNGKKNNKIAIL